jgi:acetyltransferase-like isoleucine patch superfamily enzyme
MRDRSGMRLLLKGASLLVCAWTALMGFAMDIGGGGSSFRDREVVNVAPVPRRDLGQDMIARSKTSDRVFVHPLGLCESDHVGAGTRIWAFAHVLTGAKVGRDCNICDHAYVEGGVTIGNRVTVKNGVLLFDGVTVEDDVFLGPAVAFTNDLRPRAAIKRSHADFLPTLVQRGATLGARVVVVCGLTVGAHAFIGAGAVITQDVPAHGFVIGNPGRLAGWACECGMKLGDDFSCVCGHSYKKESTGLVRVA